MRKLKFKNIVMILLMGLGATLAYHTMNHQTDTSPQKISQKEEVTGGIEGILIEKPFFALGTQQSFTIDHESHGEFDFSSYFASDKGKDSFQELKTELKAKLVRTLIRRETNQEFFIRFEVERLIAMVNGDFSESLERILRSGLELGAIVKSDEYGKIESVHFSKSLPIEAQDYIVAILKKMQFIYPIDSKDTHWKTEEEDIVGRYEASYKLADISNQEYLYIDKKRSRFLDLSFKIDGDFENSEIQAAVAGGLEYKFSKETGLLLHIKGEETIAYTNEINQTIGKNQEKVSIEEVSQIVLSETVLNELIALADQRMSESESHAVAQQRAEYGRQRRIHEKAWGQSHIEDILSQLNELTELQEKDLQDKGTALFIKMRAFSFLYPDQLSEVQQFLQTIDPGHPGFEITMAALVNIGNEQSQQVLVDILQQAKNDHPRLEATLPAVGFVNEPSLELEQALAETSKSGPTKLIQDMAELSQGVLASELKDASVKSDSEQKRENFSNRFRDIDESLLDRLRSASSKEEILQILSVIGNFGSKRALPFIESLVMESNDGEIANQAVLSLRFLEFEAIQNLFRRASQRSDINLAKAIASSLSFMPKSQEKYRFELELLSQVGDGSVKIQLLDNLYQSRHFGKDELIYLLKDYAQNSQDENLKHYAVGLLDLMEMDS